MNNKISSSKYDPNWEKNDETKKFIIELIDQKGYPLEIRVENIIRNWLVNLDKISDLSVLNVTNNRSGIIIEDLPSKDINVRLQSSYNYILDEKVREINLLL